MPDPTPPTFEVQLPSELELGAYANVLSVWHSPFEFTLDFATTLQAVQSGDDAESVIVPCRVVARVKLPPTVVFDVLRALNDNMTRYEASYGEIKRPQPTVTDQEEPRDAGDD